MTEKYKVTGMSCAACSARVEKAVSSVDGVESCTVNLLTSEMLVTGDVERGKIVLAVEGAGYGIAEEGGKSQKADPDVQKDRETSKILIRLTVSVILLIILMYFSMGHMVGLSLPSALSANPMAVGLIQLVLSAVIMVVNQKFFISGFRGLIHRAPNMDTLVSLGSLASFGYSLYLLFEMSFAVAEGIDASHYLHGLYFESAAMILTLITVGKMLEARAKGKTTDAIKSLMSLSPKTATLLVGGEEKTVSADEVKVGDVFIVKPGESFPTDAVVLEGGGAVDESMLTGESMPVEKGEGDEVSAGTINKSGYMKCRATKVGEGTVLSSIIKMVSDASATKAPIAKLADTVSGVFVPVVMGLALLTFVGWMLAGETVGYAIARGISVLVISCPCALGLATPVAIMVGSGTGARRGLLFKSATALEVTGRIKTVVLDKTGTVTRGEPTVTDVYVGDDVAEDELMTVALTLESASEHPLAAAVVKYATEKGAKIDTLRDFSIISGSGVQGKVGENNCLAVNFKYANTQTKLDEIAPLYEKLASEGKTPLIFLRDGVYLGTVAVADTVKDDAAGAVRRLKDMGLSVVMLTGDNEKTAGAIAHSVGIDRVISDVLPDGKEAVIRELALSGRVAMVGDGINDAPALARADVGIAIGAGTDIAIESADVVLMNSGLSDVPAAISLGRATLRNIRENLFWAFLYNCIGIPFAAGLFGIAMSPMIGALAMSLSSVCVVTNALRLGIFNPHKFSGKNGTRAKNHIIQPKEKEKMTKVFNVEGMMCPHCEARVKSAVEAIEGVVGAVASHKDGTVTVTLSADLADETITGVIEAQGYKVK